jgi:hypothetical protein
VTYSSIEYQTAEDPDLSGLTLASNFMPNVFYHIFDSQVFLSETDTNLNSFGNTEYNLTTFKAQLPDLDVDLSNILPPTSAGEEFYAFQNLSQNIETLNTLFGFEVENNENNSAIKFTNTEGEVDTGFETLTTFKSTLTPLNTYSQTSETNTIIGAATIQQNQLFSPTTQEPPTTTAPQAPTPPQTGTITLSDSGPATEGGTVTFTASLSRAAPSDMQLTLNNGTNISIASGTMSGHNTLTVPNDPYAETNDVMTTSIQSASGGGTIQWDTSSTVSTPIADSMDTTAITLSDSGPSIEGGTISYSATLPAPAATDMDITLSNGTIILIKQGESLGTANYTVPNNPPLESDSTLKISITSTTGGGFEELDTTSTVNTPISITLTPTITLDTDITADDIINATEAGGTVTITGTVGGDAKVGDTVTLTVNETTSTGLVVDNAGTLEFSVDVAGSDLAADLDTTIDASITTTDAAGNSGIATDTEGYSVNVHPPTITTPIGVTLNEYDMRTNNPAVLSSVVMMGTLIANDMDGNSLTFTLSAPSESLASNGQTISWSVNGAGDTLTGTIDSGATEVISITLETPVLNGTTENYEATYTVELFQPVDQPVDQADASGANNIIQGIGFTVSDGIESATETFDVTITDDIPNLDIQDGTGYHAVGLQIFGTAFEPGADVDGASVDLSASITALNELGLTSHGVTMVYTAATDLAGNATITATAGAGGQKYLPWKFQAQALTSLI